MFTTPPAPQGNLGDLGRLLMQGSFSVWTDHKRGHTRVKDLARFKPMQRHLFLHEKAVLFCKRREENGEGYEKAPSYSYKQSLNVSAPSRAPAFRGGPPARGPPACSALTDDCCRHHGERERRRQEVRDLVQRPGGGVHYPGGFRGLRGLCGCP